MRKKLILFLMLALLGSTSFLRADEVSYDFESGMQGWTTIDADGDGYTWVLASATMGSGYGHNGSADLVLSMSYNNNVGALTPNNFLVSPAKAEYSQISFFACAQDNAWAAEHFGVAVSTTGNTNASDFTTIQEWTMTAKGNGGITAPGRGGNNRTQGNWYQYGVDLSAYAGQEIWVALRHFNCTDYFYLDVDDITLGGDGNVPTPPAPYMPQIMVGSLEGAANNTYLPMNSLYDYSYSQQIYTAEEIGTSGTIDTLVMWMYGTADLPARTFDIYLKEVDKDAFDSNTDWVVVAESDMVYSGTVAFNNTTAEPYKFILNTPFYYSGEHNLLVCFNNLTGTWKSGLNGKVFGANTDPVRAIYARQDGTAYNPYEPTFSATSTTYQRNVLGLCMEGGGPTPPTGELTVLPNPFELGERPINAWMEPYAIKILNGGPAASIEGSISNNSGYNPFIMDPETIEMDIAYGEVFDAVVTVNPALTTAGDYEEEFTLFYTETKDVIQIPVSGSAYFAVAPDVVEFPGEISNPSSFTVNPTGVHANYLLPGMIEMLPDAVYHFTLSADALFNVSLDKDGIIAIYEVEDNLQITSNLAPVRIAENSMEMVLVAGDYFLIAAGEEMNTTTITGSTSAVPAPTELTYLAPENMATEIEAPLTLEWEGGDNAAQYQVLFGSNYPPQVALDWTLVDDNYGSFEIAELNPSTQYFWQIKVKNSEGQVNGPIWGFTTKLVTPTNVSLTADEIFTDGSTVVKWANMGGGGGFSGELTVADGTATSSYVPVYGLWMDDYTRCEMIYPAEMLEDMYGGEITSLKYYISSAATGPWSGDVFNVYMMEVDATTLNAFYTSTDAEIVYTGGLDGQGTEMVIDLDNSYTYGGGNLLIGIEEITCSTWKSCSFYGIEAAGASGSGYSSASLAAVPFTQRDFLPKTTFTCGGKGYRDVTANRSFQGYNVYMVYGEDNGGSNPPTPPTPPSGDSWSDDFEDGELTNWTVIDADGDGQNWVNATPASYGIGNAHSGTNCASSWSWNSVSYDPDNYMISPMFANATSIQYFVATNTGYPDHYALMASTTGSSTSDFTTVFEETVGSAKDGYHGTKSSMTKPGTRDMSAWFERNVNLPAGTKYVAFRHYNSYDMNYLFVDDVTVNLGSKNRDGELTIIKLNDEMLTTNQFLFEPDPTFYNMPEGGNIHVTAVYDEGESGFDAGNNVLYISGYSTFTGVVTELISGEPVANANVTFVGHDEFNNTVAYNNITTNASGEYTATVKVGEYTGSASADGYEVAVIEGLTNEHLTPAEVNFQIHEIYYPVYRVYAEDMNDVMAMVQWSLQDFTPAGGGGGGGGGGGTGSTFTEDFEGGVIPAGWATIDADGDGSNWVMGSAAMGSGYGHNGSADLVLSKSYDNTLGALNPNNYLVTPQVDLGASSTFRFYACAQDNAWAAEHFGVAISTGSQTNPSDFTMLQEWTMTAKGQGVPAPGRGGDLRTQGNWYEYTVDLSAYAGQQAYLAIRHFNCTDYFYLDVDDVALTNSKGDRSVNYYTLYRKALLTESSAVTDSLLLADNLTDTLYADFSWANVEPGLYQYGVSAVYPMPAEKGNRGGAYIDFETGDFSQFAFNNGGSYPWAVVAPGYNSGYCMKSTNGGVASSSSTISASVEYPTDGTVSFVAQCMGEGTSTIWDKCIFEIDGVQQFCYGANQPGWVEYSYDVEAGSHTFTWTYSKDSSVNPSGDYMQVDNVEFHYEGGGGGNNPITDVTWSNVLPKNMASVAVLTATANTGSVEGATVNLVNTCEFETGYNFNVVFDETGEVIIEDFRKGNYLVSANLDGFISDYLEPVEMSVWNDTLYLTINFTEYFMPVSTMIVSGTGYARWTDVIPAGDVAERYLVNMNNVNQGETTNCYMQLDVDGLTPGATYPAKVAVIYTTGMSPWCETTFVYQPCQNNYPNITDISNVGMDVTVTWDGGTPPTPPTPPTGDIYDFEDSTMQGWTTIDADGDGQTWELGSTAMGTGYGHNGSIDLVLSKSYDNNIGALTPDNYLVSPAKAEYPAISFYACAQDNAWAAEHFGVAVSTTTATASAFTMVQEWTMTAKGQGVPAPGRGGDRTQGNWYEYTVDLSAYAGQEIWVAIRHFNCTDYFYLDVDDITLGEGGVPPTPPTPPTGDVYDFEDSTMQGWTTIDADGDGQTWELGSTAMGTGYGHNGSSDLVLSKSYDNNIGALTPDNYLVSPAKAEYPAISFYACAQDNAWAAEHFGVAVSTTTATASAFTMVQEWTMTAKGQGVPAPGRGGDRTQGNWYEYTVDLSAYAGQEIWVAIRHFNCTDYFYLDVDDITLGEGGVPPTPPTPPTGDVYDFETGMQGWTTIDADGDGQSWDLGSTVMGSGYGHNGSSDLVLSKSYDNNIGALTPDNYLVSPAKAAYTGISFYACAQDNAWAAEHFGVAVSTTTATASAFTMVQEWTMTAKGQGVPAPGRGGDLRTQGNWYEYTVDLSAYAGQEIWVAIRHFNCTDYFYLDVDDITLGESSKRGGNLATAGMGFGVANNFTDDGNWYYYDNGTNVDAIGLTSGGSFYWGVMFPAGQYEGSTVTKVSMYDYSSHTGNILIYQGGTTAPGTLLATEAYNCTGSEDFIEVTLSSPVTIDPAQNLWIVLNNNGGQYVAACSENTGSANGRWISLDGSSWEDVASYGLSYTWMIRAYIENGGGGGTGASAITPNKFNILVDGEVVGATSGTSFTWTCPDYNEHFYEVVWVDADYNISCPDGQWYQISIIGVNENSVNSILYPNPTNGDLHINAAEMVRITVVNTLGQVVYDQAVDCDETIINMARFDAGIYMVSIATKNGTSVKRVVVTK